MLSEDKRIKTKADLKEWLAVETELYSIKNIRQWISYMLQVSERTILRKHIILLRKTEYYRNSGHKLMAALYYARLMKIQNRYGLHYPANCFGKGLRVMHVGPVIYNGDVTVGENCHVHTFSSCVDSGNGDVPTIGDNVVIGIGAKIVGGVTIADNISIGAGAVVTKDFLEPGITIAGVPARKIRDSRTVY